MSRAGGGVLAAEDLAGCRPRIVPSLEIPYRGYSLHAARGLTAAPTLADVLDRLSGKRFRASAGRGLFRGADRCAAAGLSRAARRPRRHQARRGESCTTHITAIDREGGIAALTTTLLSSFGSRYVLPQTGILMNNGIMWFDPRPGRPNSIGPGKRALTNMCPLVAARDGRPRFGVGASGGRRILAAVVQMASFIVDFAMTPGTGGASAAHRCQRRDRHRDRPAPARAGARPAAGAARRERSSSTRSGRSNSPARTSCCAARTGSITASPT